MIRPLRRAHRLLATVLAIVVPTALALILPHHHDEALPATTVETAQTSAQAIGRGLACSSMVVFVRVDAASMPELLAYEAAPGADTVDANAHLIGQVDPALMNVPLPKDVPNGPALLYSPPLGKVVARESLHARPSP